MGLVDGKVALVTGAARGQGRAEAVRLAEEGADIIAVDICEPVETIPYEGATLEDLEETATLVRKHGRSIITVKADVRDLAALQAALGRGTAELGRLDIVVANAGVMGALAKTWELTEDDWQTTIDVNLTGVWHTIKATVPYLIQQGAGGSVILTSSVAGLKGVAHTANYTSAKHALVGLARTVAREAGEYNIRVNCVHPGSIPTKLLLHDTLYKIFRPNLEAPTLEDCMRVFEKLNMLPGAFQQPEDVANAVLFLASDLAKATTGTSLTVDGGASFM
jgi:(+)-trans-carveol dehydrogenase